MLHYLFVLLLALLMSFTDQLGTDNPVDSVVLGQGVFHGPGFDPGDIFVSKQNDAGVFHQYASDGSFVRDITLQLIDGFDPYVRTFAQYRNFLYVTADNGGDPLAIQEYNASGAYVRTPVEKVDETDPAQNPDSLTEGDLFFLRFDVDSQGRFLAAGSEGYPRVWMWTNAGSFVKTFLPDTTSNTPGNAQDPVHTVNACSVSTLTDDEMVLVNNSNSIAGDIFRYNPTTETDLSGFAVPDGGNFLTSRYTKDGRFLKPIGSGGSTAIRIYAAGWGSSSDLPITLPVGFNQLDLVAPTSDNDIVWLFVRASATANTSMYRLRLSTNTALDSPIAITSGTGWGIEDALVWQPVSSRRNTSFVHWIY